ncbi:MAG: hypothetical protein HY842_18365, partial [Bacteroidetes bacterium]|nr:hypothetical protein [Bacteroidota bacterium]
MKNFFLLLVFSSPACLLAQTVTVSESVVLRDDASYDIIGDDRGNVLLFRDKSTKFEVQGFDSKMRLSWEKEIELDKKAPQVEKVVPTAGGGFSVIYQFRQKMQPVLKIHKYSAAANLIDSVTIKLFDPALFTPNFEVVLSEDKNMAVVWFLHEQTEINALAFDIKQMKLLWEKTFVPEDMLLHRDFQQVVADNAGNMYFILKKDNFNSRHNKHYLEILDYGTGTAESLRRYLVPMQDYLTFDAFFAYDNLNQALKAGGLYSADNLSRAEGYFFLSIPQANTSDQLLRFYPFEDEFVSVLLEKEKGKNRGIPEASVQDIVMRTDGG